MEKKLYRPLPWGEAMEEFRFIPSATARMRRRAG